MPDRLVQTGLGSTDWNGGAAPAGGTHTGTSTVTMTDGATFVVAHSASEVLQKLQQSSVAPGVPLWVAFDLPDVAVPAILDVSRVQAVGSGSIGSIGGTWSPKRLWGTFLWGE